MSQKQTSENKDPLKYRFYGRRQGKTLRGARKAALENGLKKHKISLSDFELPNRSPIWLEIGFGATSRTVKEERTTRGRSHNTAISDPTPFQ